MVCLKAAGRSVDSSKQRPLKQLSQPAIGTCESVDGVRLRGSQSSEGSDLTQNPAFIAASSCSVPFSPVSDTSVRDPDYGKCYISCIFFEIRTTILSCVSSHVLVIALADSHCKVLCFICT